jgi:hypothetical protein
MAVGNQKTQKMDMYVKIYKENYQFLKPRFIMIHTAFFVHIEMVTAPDNIIMSLSLFVLSV